MKILLLSSQPNFINQIASLFKEKQSGIIFCALSENKSNAKKFAEYFDTVEVLKLSYSTIFFYLFQLPRVVYFSIQSLFILLLNFKQGLKSLKCVYDAFGYVGKMQHFHLSRFNIINVHYLTIKKAIAILLLPPKVKIIISFWGSDLFRTGGLTYNFWIRKALSRASTIHVSSNEMRMSLLSEFGYGIESKIKFALFVPSYDQIKQIDAVSTNSHDQLNELRRKYLIKGERCIMIGNNGNRGNNHIHILNAIKKIVHKENITVILPLTYKLNKEYKAELETFILKNKMDAILLTEYLSNEDMAALKVTSDIFITMQQTDAMSAFFTESLYAKSVCIAASWLPYSTFRQSGAYYIECPEFDKLDQTLENILRDFTNEINNCKKNPSIIKSTFFNKEKLSESWENIFSTE